MTQNDRAFFGHPRGLATLFFTEMWERFSYYGMRALLILFMTAGVEAGGLGFAVDKAGAIYGLYTASVYLLSLPGGWLADRFLGQRKAVLYGGIIIALGHFSMAFPMLGTFYFGLVLISCGTGLLKPNVSTMVGTLYEQGDVRRDAGFSIFYMGINLGAFIAPLVCGYFGQNVNWHLGFALAGVGMTLGLIQYLAGARSLGDAGLYPTPAADEREAAVLRGQLFRGMGSVVVLCVALALLGVTGVVEYTPAWISNAFGLGMIGLVIVTFGLMFTTGEWTPGERNRLIVVAVFFFASALFWGVFEQAGSTLNLFADRNTETRILGWAFPSSWFQSANAMFIILLAGVFAWIWVKLGKNDPSSGTKFSIGLISAGLGFAVLIPAAQLSGGGEKVSPLWLLGVFFLHTVGELCLSPVGLSAMTKLAPARVGGFVMGIWFLATALGNYMGGRVASLYESFSLAELFGAVAATAIVAGLLLAVFVKPIARLAAGEQERTGSG
ncbi:MAG: peptide MFS transporter [Acidimicrobiia bacterium]|nr:peptide MFS transporter [Acidimicrobiia bacterium]